MRLCIVDSVYLRLVRQSQVILKLKNNGSTILAVKNTRIHE